MAAARRRRRRPAYLPRTCDPCPLALLLMRLGRKALSEYIGGNYELHARKYWYYYSRVREICAVFGVFGAAVYRIHST